LGGYTGAGTTAPGESIAVTMPYYNNQNSGRTNTTAYLYGYDFPLNPAKAVTSVSLNNNMAIFALDLVSTPAQVNLNAAPDNSSPAFNLAGISLDKGAQYANLDGSGHSYSAKAMGNTITWSGQVFNIGSAMINDVIQAERQTISLPAGYLTNLMLLGAATNGVQSNQTFTVNYNDGSHSTFTQTISNWVTGYTGTGGTTAPGESIAAVQTYYELLERIRKFSDQQN